MRDATPEPRAVSPGPDYQAPVAQSLFALAHAAGAEHQFGRGAFRDVNAELIQAVLEEAGKFASGVLAPLNRTGDIHGAALEAGAVRLPPGFADAYRQFADGGWAGISTPAEYGGQGLPHALGVAVQEYWQSANMAFGLCPILSQGAIEALMAHGTAEQKARYLPKLVSGQWTGTMNLTEPHAGSDVGAIKARAVRASDGRYRITGTKIYITWGEHPAAENIIHLVLARLPEAPIGTRGISLFLVPKVLVNPDGSLGARNDLRCVGLEHKLGIHGSPTCVMSYGDQGGATGYLVGSEHKGMAAMFTMMNAARLNVGVQGVAIGERAYQAALAFAKTRLQGKPYGLSHEMAEMIPIIQHPDVRRMLLTMRAQVEAARAICLAAALAMDEARHGEDAAARERAKGREEFLTPIAKAWSTDRGVEVASLGVQIHGGMGFIEETGAAQHYRDARIAPIYEGTNGIQAIDLAGRKLALQGGAATRAMVEDWRETASRLSRASALPEHAKKNYQTAAGIMTQLVESMSALMKSEPVRGLAGATPFLEAAGLMTGAHYLFRAAIAADEKGRQGTMTPFLRARIDSAAFFAANLLPKAAPLAASALGGGDEIMRATVEELSA